MSNGGTGNGSKPFKFDADDLRKTAMGLGFALLVAAMQWLQDWSSETDFGIWGPIITSAVASLVVFGRQWVKDNSKALIFAFAFLIPAVAMAQSHDLLGGSSNHNVLGSVSPSVAKPSSGDVPSSWRQSYKPQIVFFTGSWCSVCNRWEREQRRRMEKSGWKFGDADSTTAHVRTVDEGKRPDLASGFNITAYPTFLVVDDDKVLKRITGYATAEELNVAIRQDDSAPPPPDAQVAESKPEEPKPRKTALCQCQGYKHSVCMCLAEMRAGIRPLSQPCGCNRSKASEHYIDDNGKPTGGTGRYIYKSTSTPTIQRAPVRIRQSAIRSRPAAVC